MSESRDVVVALDIGGTKLAAGLVSADGDVLCREERPTGGVDAEALFSRVAALLDEAQQAVVDGGHLALACGVGCGGPMTPGGEEVSPLNIHQWRGFPLRRRVAEHTGLLTAVDNDAKALALGEGWRGAASGLRNYIAMVVSTGVGGGIVVDGRLLEGETGNAGHIGHVVVEPDGRPCVCGGRGCLEAEVSGLSIEAATGRPAAEATPETIERAGRLVGTGADVGRCAARPSARDHRRLGGARVRRPVLRGRPSRARSLGADRVPARG